MRSDQLRILWKYLWYVILILAIPLIVLAGNYMYSSQRLQEEEYTKNRIVLEGCAKRVNDMLRGIDGMAYSFENDSRIRRFFQMDTVEEDPTIISDLHTARDIIRSYEVFNDAVDLVQLYAKKSGILVDSSTIGIRLDRYYGSVIHFDDVSFDQWKQGILGAYHKGDFYSGVDGTNATGKSSKWLIYAKSLPTTVSSNLYQGNLIVLLDEQYFLDFFRETQFDQGGFLYGWNIDGSLVLNENHSKYSEEWINEILDDTTQDEGYLVRDGMSLTFLKDERYGLHLVVGVPVDVVLKPVKALSVIMRVLIVVSFLTALLIGLLAIWRLTRRERSVYQILSQYNSELERDNFEREIDALVRNNHVIMERLDQYVPHQQIAIFYNILFGGYRNEEDFKKAMQDLRIDPTLQQYVVLILHITETAPEDSYRNLGIKKMFIREKIQEILGERPVFDLKRDELVMLVAGDSESKEAYQSFVDEKVGLLLDATKDIEGMSLAVTGEICDQYQMIPRSFRHAMKALQYEEKDSRTQIQWYKPDADAPEGDEESVFESSERRDRVIRFVHQHYKDPQMSLTMAADAIGITEIYLSRLFKQVTGDNFSKYVESLRMKDAAELLKSDAYSINEVAEKVGYNSPQVFRRAYRRYYGVTPSEARRAEK